MPLSYKIGRRLLRFTVKGDVEYAAGLETVRQAFDEVRRSIPPGGPLWNVLIDISASTEKRSTDELQGLAMAFAQHSDLFTGRVAIVAAEHMHFQRVADFSVFAEKLGQTPRVFGDLAEAEAWLAS